MAESCLEPVIAIVGAGRSRNGLGPFIAKFFHAHGADVKAVLGTGRDSAQKAAQGLSVYGIEAEPFYRFDNMIASVKPDAVVIASPKETHLQYFELCVDAGCHIFCEKPLIWPVDETSASLVDTFLKKAESGGRIVAMNSQLPFVLPSYEKLCDCRLQDGPNEFFEARMSPMISGPEMIPDSLPHPLSLLYAVLGKGRAERIRFEGGESDIRIYFDYVYQSGSCRVFVHLKQKTTQPRRFHFGFDGRRAVRHVDLTSYEIYFNFGSRTLKIPDPLKVSVLDFLGAVKNDRPPLVGPDHIRCTTNLLQEIFSQYERNR